MNASRQMRIAPGIAAFTGGMLFLAPAAPVAEAQTPTRASEIAVGVQYGVQDPERPVTPGWIVSGGFDLGRRTFVVEGAWHRDTYVPNRHPGFDEGARATSRDRYLMLTGGVRGGKRGGRAAPFYQVLAGGFANRFRTDYEWPDSLDVEAENAGCGVFADGRLVLPCRNVPYPRFEEERAAGFVMQPGMGMDLRVGRRFTLRLAADLPIFTNGDYVALRPRISARVAVEFGR